MTFSIFRFHFLFQLLRYRQQIGIRRINYPLFQSFVQLPFAGGGLISGRTIRPCTAGFSLMFLVSVAVRQHGLRLRDKC